MANGNDRQKRLIDLLSGGGLMENDLAGPIELTDTLRQDVNVQTVPGSNADVLTNIGTNESTTRSIAQRNAPQPTSQGADLSGRQQTQGGRIIDALRAGGTVDPDPDTPNTPGNAANPEEVGEAASALSGLQKFLENPANQQLLAQFGMSFAPQDEGLQQLGQSVVSRAQGEQMNIFRQRLSEGMSPEDAAEGLALSPEARQQVLENVMSERQLDQQDRRIGLEEERVDIAGERLNLDQEAQDLREQIQTGQLELEEAALRLQQRSGNRDFSIDRARLLLQSERLDIQRRNAQLRFAEMMQDAADADDLQLGMFDRVQSRIGREFLTEARETAAERLGVDPQSEEVIRFLSDPVTGSIEYDRVFNQLSPERRQEWREMSATMAEQIRGGAGLEQVTSQMFGGDGEGANVPVMQSAEEAREQLSPGDRFRTPSGAMFEVAPEDSDREIIPVQ